MHFHEQAIDSGRHAGAREVRNVLRLTARALSLCSRQLKAVRDIKHDGATETLHDRETPEIDDEIVIPE